MNMENLTTSSDGGTCQVPSSKRSTRSHKSCFDDLDDDLLLEILLRLPTAKHALVCTSVCKNWYRTILNRSFTARFVIHHMDSSDDVNSNCNVATYDPRSSHDPLLLCQNPNFEIKRLDFSRLWEGSEWGSIVSSCNDLVLYMAMKGDGFRYFICNCLTMQNTALTVPADWLVKRGEPPFHPDMDCALICEPYCSRDAELQTALNDGCRYRVLRFRRDIALSYLWFAVEMYCSETPDKWDTVYFLHEGELREVESDLVAYRGKVHWSNGQHIVAYDPFTTVGCYVDDFSRRFCDTSASFCIPHPRTDEATEGWSPLMISGLGICQSRLRYMELGSFDKKGICLRVWDLKGYENKEWSVDRWVSLHRLGSKSMSVVLKVLSSLARWSNVSLRRSLMRRSLAPDPNSVLAPDPNSVLAPHPIDEDIVYFIFADIIASCNMRTEELEVLAEFPRGLASTQCEIPAQLLAIPWWPTPILQHPQEQ